MRPEAEILRLETRITESLGQVCDLVDQLCVEGLSLAVYYPAFCGDEDIVLEASTKSLVVLF